MKTTAFVLVSAASLTAALSVSSNGAAIPLPDTGTCNSHPCLKISSTLNSGTALYARNDNSIGNAVYGGVFDGVAIWGEGGSGEAIRGNAALSGGMGGHFIANASGGTAVVAECPGGTAAWFEGNVFYTGTLSQSSDARLKKDVRDLQYGLNDMLKLRPVTYKWKRSDEGKDHLGLIAQEVAKVVPEIVSLAHDPSGSDMMTVNYVELLPLLIQSAQEQHRLIAKQEARIAELERGRSAVKGSSLIGGAMLGLIPVGLVLATRRRKGQQLPERQ
ncbi:MAG TPA: tail fiber domain-containing protein [Polyangiaceae bacterium]|nr:tail fiber domain-containing protein [Polyangiaceae bacterium]